MTDPSLPVALIVDDSLTVRMDLAETFEAAGFVSLTCGTIAEARALLETETVAVAILDVLLPDGDGTELLALMRTDASRRHIPVLMLSTEADVQDRIRGLQFGADDYVGKPYDSGYVVSRAKELVRAQNPTHEERATILVIDDSPTFRNVLSRALEGAGYVVLTATSGEEGLRRAADARPTALIVDGVMDGIDGATVIRRIRMDAACRGTPCLLLTASGEKAAELSALDAGADAFVRKDEDLEVILARLAAVLRSAHTAPRETVALLAPKRILVVDDSETYLHQVGEALREDGYDVVFARSGQQAIELLAVQPVDCVLLDLVMPGLSGKDTCQRIKTSPVVRDIPLVMVTSLENRDAMIEGLAVGADDYISKSADFEVLKARVRAQIRRKQFEDEHRKIQAELLTKELEASEARAARQVAETRAALTEELERKNQELEAFSYSVSHDLRAPLRTIDGFSQILMEDYADRIDEQGREYLGYLRSGAQRMATLIDDMLELSRVGRAELRIHPTNLSTLVRGVLDELGQREPERKVTAEVEPDVVADADQGLLRILFDNLIGNAWKFTSKTPEARITFRSEKTPAGSVYMVSDNGAGFDMTYAERLFGAFQRLHNESEFPGTGVGLATAYRIVDRHGGRIWAHGETGKGATLSFTLTRSRDSDARAVALRGSAAPEEPA